uniref:Variant surface glycoprotein 1125.31 n=1 Tax=Trypanosoma brucei TaxID=5691 RepID=M4TDV0_9TRYP|nr:variant surface glycoprotein 672 [Trypanosoma brucei]APD72584.1 variant surface glycoprotein 1125.31 [Trypanosoma brucei]
MLWQLMTLFLLTSKAESAVNSNAAEFKALCDLIRLAEAKGKIDISIDTSAADNAIKELAYLNLSAAGESWRKDKNGLLTEAEPDKKADERAAWKKHVEGLEEIDAKTGKPKYTKLTHQRRRKSLAIALSRTMSKAQETKENYAAYVEAIRSAKAKANKALTDALYGKDNTAFTKQGLQNTQDKNCKDDSGGIAGKALAWDLLCLCTGDQSNTVKLCDQSKTGGQVADYTSGSDARDAYIATLRACPATDPATQPTTKALEEALTVFKSLIGRQAATASGAPAHYIYGLPHTTAACNGASNQGMCISYKTSVKGGRTSIPWAEALSAAAAEMQAAAQALTEARTLSTQLTTMTVHAWALFDDVLHEPLNQQPIPFSAQNTAKPSEDKEKECNSAKDDKEACKKLEDKGCVFNTESNKCELKKDVKEKLEKESQETEGKDEKANTTGSDSFVINKAPLLLAVLLF